MSAVPSLIDHPRLYLTKQAIGRIRSKPELPLLKRAAEQVRAEARRYAKLPPLRYSINRHNGLLQRTQQMQDRVLALLTEWVRTGENLYRRAVINNIRQMNEWEHWSWVAWRNGQNEPDAIFDLSYGENSFILAVAYDWLAETLSAEEKELFLATARRWSFASANKHFRKGGAWWFAKGDTNWNSICAGGLGMLCLAMHEDAPEARELLGRVERSMRAYMRHLDHTDGAWPEGTGYWNYGMRYAFRYLLSWESAAGRPHPLMKLRGTRRTLTFPMDFCPHGQPCSFGDGKGHWSPEPFHYAVAERLGADEVRASLDGEIARRLDRDGRIDYAPEWLALHPGRTGPGKADESGPTVRLYKGLDWALLADSMPRPSLYLAVRGGSTDVPHGHRDLLSFHCVIGDEVLLTDVKNVEYLDTTFSSRREELFEINPLAKNTLLINGVGVRSGSALKATRKVTVAGLQGVLLDASGAWGEMTYGSSVRFCGRLVLMLPEHGFLIVDRVVLSAVGRFESRIHSYADVRATRRSAVVRGDRRRMRLTYAASIPAMLLTATTSPTTPTAQQATVLRWCSETCTHKDAVLATLLTAGAVPARLAVGVAGGGITVCAGGKGWEKTVRLTDRLREPKAK